MSDWNEIKKVHYGSKTVLMSSFGTINFDADNMQKVVGGDKLTYDEYLEIQKNSGDKIRHSFELCYHEIPMNFKGEIERIGKGKICFKRIYVEGMYADGLMFEGTEDHVWMDIDGFECFVPGDCVSFCAEVYRYLKTGNGKKIDYALRNPDGITKIESYELPSEEELQKQMLGAMRCENCYLSDQCAGSSCCIRK